MHLYIRLEISDKRYSYLVQILFLRQQRLYALIVVLHCSACGVDVECGEVIAYRKAEILMHVNIQTCFYIEESPVAAIAAHVFVFVFRIWHAVVFVIDSFVWYCQHQTRLSIQTDAYFPDFHNGRKIEMNGRCEVKV